MQTLSRPASWLLLAALGGCAVQQYDPNFLPDDGSDAGKLPDVVLKKDVIPVTYDLVTPTEDVVTPSDDVVAPVDDTAPVGDPDVQTAVDAGGARDVPTAGEDVIASPDVAGCAAGLTRCGTACVDPRTDVANCGACGTACPSGGRCTAGACSCGIARILCGGVCVLPDTDVANCGACGRACAAGQSCIGGACAVVCPTGQTSCGGTCTTLATDATNCGACGNACSMGATCAAGRCVGGTLGGPSFQVNALQTTGCRVADHLGITGDDHGGIAVSADAVFYTGDNATGRFNAETLAGTGTGRIYEALVSNLRSGAVYTFANGTTPLGASGGSATTLLEINSANGALSGRSVALGAPITISGYGRVGFFSGWDRAVVLTGGRAYHVTLPSGEVMDLGTVAFPAATPCESWAIWGVAEFFGGALYADFVQSSTVIARMRLPDGMTAPLSRFTNLSDMCSFTVQPTLRRWYFHHEYGGQFGGSAETVGYCDAQVVADGLACPAGQSACGPACRDLQTDVTNCGACGAACAAGQVCAAGVCGCPAGQTLCGATCASTGSDVANCGACGTACASGELCLAGTCGVATRYTMAPAPSEVAWIDVCGAQRILTSTDDAAQVVTLPFAFPWWGALLPSGRSVNVSTNGFLSMDGTYNSSLSGSIPSASTPNGVIAPQWGDLVTGTSGVCVGVVGASPARSWVAQWSGATNFSAGGALNFEVILREGSGAIDFVYGTMSAQPRTVGVENPAGTAAVGGCASTTCTIASNTRIRFTPAP